MSLHSIGESRPSGLLPGWITLTTVLHGSAASGDEEVQSKSSNWRRTATSFNVWHRVKQHYYEADKTSWMQLIWRSRCSEGSDA